ncbi:hypothetical protein DPMN_116158 [Dreissena polymorpha]|uniref:Uncharacterized protein n=1 Tax=Dreissena polymorpha TaxID=45954 RepID=A0A9D4QT58_DREPO|nr:hypothetical protein DPMN_116158 [Dreissena polymorpha]
MADADGNIMPEHAAVRNRWTKYCSDFYEHPLQSDPRPEVNETNQSILKPDLEEAVHNLKNENQLLSARSPA